MSQSATPFNIVRADLISSRTGISNQFVSHDVRNAVSDITIYEHINKPYTTAIITIADNADTLSSLDIQGGEFFDIEIKPTVDPLALGIKKRYYITEILNSVRSGDLSEVHVFNCVDENHWWSTQQNVNDPLSGSPLEMILQIANDYFPELNILHEKQNFKQNHKVIVPNKTPLDTMVWLNHINKTKDGLPYFLYATMGDNVLRCFSLEELIEQEPFNKKKPFRYGYLEAASNNQVNDYSSSSFNIQYFDYKNNHRIYDYINKGYTRATHRYYDTVSNRSYDIDFNAVDAFSNLHKNEIYKRGSSRYPLPAKSQTNEIDFHGQKHRVISNISTNRPYTGYYSYNERFSSSDYSDLTNQRAYREYLVKDPITIQIDGKYLGTLHGTKDKTLIAPHLIGQKARILFRQTVENPMKDQGGIDIKKSGDYIIHSVKHKLQRERYDCTITGVKLGGFDNAEVASQ